MSIAILDEHRELARTASDLLAKRGSLQAARDRLEAPEETLPPFWADLVELGWLGLHLPEKHGGSGYGIEELAIVVEELGRAVAPGPFVPTVVVSAFLAAADSDSATAELLADLAGGALTAGVALSAAAEIADGTLSGNADLVVGAPTAAVLAVPVGDDVALVRVGPGVHVQARPSLDTTRRAAPVRFQGAAATVIPGKRQVLVDLGRVLFAAEAVGVARQCTEMAASYAKERVQFGRPIGTYQAVKHHCANMLVATELATAAVWDAARAAATGGDQLTYAAATAAALAAPAADMCANLNTQVHGGIAITWEHDAHLYMRRATSLLAVLAPSRASEEIVELARRGVARSKAIELPPEAEPIRQEVRSFAESMKGLGDDEQRERLIETGYVMPHWPKPYGRAASATEQLVIEEEFAAAGVKRPAYGITGWVILTLIQYGTPDQVERWVLPALRQEVIWCQLFSEPDAGSDAAGIKTRAKRVDGGWLVNGQKVWTSGAHVAGKGFATVRTNPDVPKHDGITTMVVDMNAPGVEVRPLKMTTGMSEFNEVFFDDVFVPDDDVVGPVDGGWTVARATLGNESVSIGGGQGAMSIPGSALLPSFDANPDRLFGGAPRVGRYLAGYQAMGLLNLRSAHRAVAGGEPGAEGAVTKLVLSELLHEATAILTEVNGADSAYTDGAGAMTSMLVLMHRAMSIAGGTSEIKRNQIGERILGLPRDPLISR